MIAAATSWPEAILMCVFVICVTVFGAYALYLRYRSIPPAAVGPEASASRWEYKRTTKSSPAEDGE